MGAELKEALLTVLDGVPGGALGRSSDRCLWTEILMFPCRDSEGSLGPWAKEGAPAEVSLWLVGLLEVQNGIGRDPHPRPFQL